MPPEPDCDERLAQCLMEIRHSAEQMAFRSQELYQRADEYLAALRARDGAAAVPPAAVAKRADDAMAEAGGVGSPSSRAGGEAGGEVI